MTELQEGAVVLDTETTDKENGEVIELAYSCSTSPLDPDAVWHGHVHRFSPRKPSTYGALATHHILPSELEGLEPSEAAISHVPHARYWIGHNIDFDWRALGSPAGIFRICTLALCRKWFPDADSHGLSAMVYRIEGPTEMTREIVRAAHGAKADVFLTQIVLREIIRRTRVETLSGLFAESEDSRVPRKWSFGKFESLPISSADRGYASWYVKNCRDNPDYMYYIVALRRAGLL